MLHRRSFLAAASAAVVPERAALLMLGCTFLETLPWGELWSVDREEEVCGDVFVVASFFIHKPTTQCPPCFRTSASLFN